MARDMSYLNRNALVSPSNQVLTTFDWDFDITFPANYAPYHPPIETIRQRILSIDGIKFIPDPVLLDIKLRGGVTMLQAGLTENKPGSLTLMLQDFEDQSMTIWALDWTKKLNDWRTRKSYRKESVYIDMTIYQLNSDREAVFQWNYMTGLLDAGEFGSPAKADKDALTGQSMTINFEYVEPIPLNLG